MSSTSHHTDVLIVGAGPAGLSAAIRLAQLQAHSDTPCRITVLEKAPQPGNHNLSGAVMDASALTQLLPQWQRMKPPPVLQVARENNLYLTEKKARPLPLRLYKKNQCHYLISLSALCRWLANEAMQRGVDIVCATAAQEPIFNEHNQLIGMKTHTAFIANKQAFHDQDWYARYTLIADGTHGPLSRQLIQHFHLAQGKALPQYALGIKELWQIDRDQHRPGQVTHTWGWPSSDARHYTRGMIYHYPKQRLAMGFISSLDYQNPYFDPAQTLQQLKSHPTIQPLLQNATCLEYGAACLPLGGWDTVPECHFPGGILLGASANINHPFNHQGIHLAIKTGYLAAQQINQQWEEKRWQHTQLRAYAQSLALSSIKTTMTQCVPAHTTITGRWLSTCWRCTYQGVLWRSWRWPRSKTKARKPLYSTMQTARFSQPLLYPEHHLACQMRKTQLRRYAGIHYAFPPEHVLVDKASRLHDINYSRYDSPERHYCPVGVFALNRDKGQPRLQIDAQHCIQCQCCTIKDPSQTIRCQVAAGGDGPRYQEM